MVFTFDRGNDHPALFPRSGRLSVKCGEVGRDRVEVTSTGIMKIHAANGNGACGPQSRTAVCRANNWLENYIGKNPYTDAAIEARKIIRELETVRTRPGTDESLGLIGQIAKSDQGLQEINRAKIRMTRAAPNNR
jgi:hypothetical protein